MVSFFLNFIYVVLLNMIFKLANLQPVVRKFQIYLQGRRFYGKGLPYFRPPFYKPFKIVNNFITLKYIHKKKKSPNFRT